MLEGAGADEENTTENPSYNASSPSRGQLSPTKREISLKKMPSTWKEAEEMAKLRASQRQKI